MNQVSRAKVDDATRSTFILAVMTPGRAAEVHRLLSLTRWRTHVVLSIQEAVQAIRSLPISVVLCEDTLSDGNWLNIVRETERRCPRPETIVLSHRADTRLWAEVLSCGGYDLLPMPLELHEVNTIIPMASCQCAGTARPSTRIDAGKSTPELTGGS